MTPSEVITLAGTVISEIVSQTGSLFTNLPFVALPMAFAFGGRIISGAKGLLLYHKGKRR